MNQEPVDMERRLLLAFALALIVLAGWPLVISKLGFVPPPSQQIINKSGQDTPPSIENQQKVEVSNPPQADRISVSREVEMKSSILGWSDQAASLSEIRLHKPTYRTEPGELELGMPDRGPGLGTISWSGDRQAPMSGPWMGWESSVESTPQRQVWFVGRPLPELKADYRYDLRGADQNVAALTLTVQNQGGTPQTIRPRLLAGQTLNDPLEQGRNRLLRASVGGKTQNVTLKRDVGDQRRTGAVAWVAAQTKYYATIVEPQTASAALLITRDQRGEPQAWIEWPEVTLKPGEQQAWSARLYAGPLDYRFLDALKLDHAVTLGTFTTITRLLRAAMNSLTGWLNSYGAAIVVLTLLLSLVFAPLTWASFRTMKKMELVQPELKALQERHRSDPRRLNEEVMKIYKKRGVNPLGGCLPLLLQMPIFIALYQVLSRSPELRGAHFLIIKDLSAPDAIIPLPTVLPVLGSAINVLPLAMAGMMFLQQRMSSKGRVLTEEQRVQQQVFKVMPVLFGVMFYTLPSGLVLYWLLNTTFAVVQQQLVLRRMT